MNQLTASVASQKAILAVLSVKTHIGSGSRKNTIMKKVRIGLHVCTHYKREVCHKDGNCLELSANKAKRYMGLISVLE